MGHVHYLSKGPKIAILLTAETKECSGASKVTIKTVRRVVMQPKWTATPRELRTYSWGYTGARLTKAYDVTIQRYRNSHAKIEDSKMHILFVVYGFKILCEISKVPFEISHKILNPYTAKYEF